MSFLWILLSVAVIFIGFLIVVSLVHLVVWGNERINCYRCGKVLSFPKYHEHSKYCRSCQKEYFREVERASIELMKKCPEKMACGGCEGSGRIKGYKCVLCNGRGYHRRPGRKHFIEGAMKALRQKPGWSAISFSDDPPGYSTSREVAKLM